MRLLTRLGFQQSSLGFPFFASLFSLLSICFLCASKYWLPAIQFSLFLCLLKSVILFNTKLKCATDSQLSLESLWWIWILAEQTDGLSSVKRAFRLSKSWTWLLVGVWSLPAQLHKSRALSQHHRADRGRISSLSNSRGSWGPHWHAFIWLDTFSQRSREKDDLPNSNKDTEPRRRGAATLNFLLLSSKERQSLKASK